MQKLSSSNVDDLISKVKRRESIIGVIGMGYVGLPLALASIKAGFQTVGVDIDESRVELLNRGQSGIQHITSSPLEEALAEGRFRATCDLGELASLDTILVAVPTPLSKQREPDLSYVETSARAIAATLRPGQLVVLESTTWPGTTREVMKPILETSGLKAGGDFYLAYSPEREDPGNSLFGTTSIPKVVGADDQASLRLACALYDSLVVETVPVSTSATAEAVKLTENVFRSVNIALVNELKVIFGKMGIDIWEVVDAAKTKPFGYMPFYPGPGLGGHCIPIDPFYLTWKAREYEITTRFIELAGQINTEMPHYVVARLAEALDRKVGRGLKAARILIIGLSYKRNIDDTRESPSLKLIRLLEQRGAVTDYHDPFVSVIPRTREYPELIGRRSVDLEPEAVRSYDAVVIGTDHDNIDWSGVVANARLVVDTRNICARNQLTAHHVIKA